MRLFETKICPSDAEKISELLKGGNLGFGQNVILFEQGFAKLSNKEYNISTNSASAAAFMLFAYFKQIYGSCDVYTTSLGFTSPAWAAKHFGHRLIFVDVRDDLQFCSEDYKRVRERHQTNSRKAIVMPVLYGGVSMIPDFELFGDEIVVTDSAHCATPTIKSDYVFFSFHPYKPICTSDGGMVSTNDEAASKYFLNYRNFGRQQGAMNYDITQSGFKFYMNNLNATIGLTQIERYEENLNNRKLNFAKLTKRYNLLQHDEMSSYYFATAITSDAEDIISKTGIARNYPMLHKTSYYDVGDCLPNLERLHSSILNLPLSHEFEI